MKCQKCGKKEATVNYLENINGKKQEFHLCSECIKKVGIVDISNIFSPVFVTIPKYEYEEELKCCTCGYTLDDYSKTGMFGCPDCYKTFEDSLDHLFLKLHGKNRHVKIEEKNTKINNKSDEGKSNCEDLEINDLREKLKKMIDEENYEEAAIIRDEIKKIEGK